MKRLIAHTILGAALSLSATGAASASIIFDFHDQASTSGDEAFGNTLTSTVGGLTITETAWWVPDTSAATTFQTAALSIYNGYGLTVCSPPEGPGCGSPDHQIDNSNGVEFVSFQFSTPVSLSNVQLYVYAPFDSSKGSDADVTYFTPAAPLTTSTNFGSLGTETDVNQDCTADDGSVCTYTVITDPLTGSNVSNLLVGASVPNTDGITDAFKIYSLAIDAPEPGSFSMLFLLLPGFGVAAWRRRRSLISTVR
jgi:hypothetical protein